MPPMAAGPIHAYLSGHGKDGAGRSLDSVLALPDRQLEHIHDYIQWLFLLPTRSMAQPHSPVLTAEEIAAIRADPAALANLARATERMLAFYRQTDDWLVPSDHNHLRISRILQSLTILSGPEAARRFYTAIIARVEASGARIAPGNRRYWDAAVQAGGAGGGKPPGGGTT